MTTIQRKVSRYAGSGLHIKEWLLGRSLTSSSGSKSRRNQTTMTMLSINGCLLLLLGSIASLASAQPMSLNECTACTDSIMSKLQFKLCETNFVFFNPVLTRGSWDLPNLWFSRGSDWLCGEHLGQHWSGRLQGLHLRHHPSLLPGEEDGLTGKDQ